MQINAIGVEGARVILQSTENNKARQTNVHIDNEYNRDSEVRTMINIMEDRRRMKTNVVGYLL